MREPHDVDDETAAYILQTRMPFEGLRQVASQIAGALVLSASGADTASPDHPLLDSALELYREAVDGVRAARPTKRARIHHRCLLDASTALGVALTAARTNLEADFVMVPLRCAYDHLRKGAETLPGFEMVAFAQGCCALHHRRAAS